MRFKKFTWLAVSALLAVVMLASCGQQTQQTSATTTVTGSVSPTSTVAPTTSTAQPTTSTPTTQTPTASNVPQYGGTFNMLQDTATLGFDMAVTFSSSGLTAVLTQSRLLMTDWTKGPAGSNDITMQVRNWKRVEALTGEIAESFEIPSPGVAVFNIRKGVHYGLNPASEASKLVNGRQVTVDDIVYSLKRHITLPQSFIVIAEPIASKATTIEKTGDWQITIKVSPQRWFDPIWLMLTERDLVPPEVVQKYGDMNDWHNVVGSGPYMLTDYVKDSSTTMVRNPNYFLTDPIGPGKGNKLPYIDTVKMLYIQDVSTQWAALRTHKIDWAWKMDWEEAAKMQKTNPELKSQEYLDSDSWPIAMRTDKADLPFHDVRVRNALQLAVDYDSIKNALYGGHAEILTWPFASFKGYENTMPSMSQLPQNVQDLFKYNPDKAKQLLKDAGYGDGFTAHVIVWSTTWQVDRVSAVKDMWSKIGVNLVIEPKEYGVYSGMRVRRNYEEMMVPQALGPSPYAQLLCVNGGSTYNLSYVAEDRYQQVYLDIMDNYYLINTPKVDELFKGLVPDILENSWVIPMPTPYTYVFWTPWVKNYHGEFYTNYNLLTFPMFIWIDQGMK